jgi:hypothetical protein
MKAFKGLLIKDFIISRSWIISFVLTLLFIYFISFGLSQYYDQPMIFFPLTMVTYGFAWLCIPLYLFSTFAMEGQTNLWLHNPNGAWKLLFSKIVVGFSYQVILLILCLIASSIAIFISKDSAGLSQITIKQWRTGLFFLCTGITLTSLYLGVWSIFYWTVFQSMRRHQFLNKIKWPITIVLFILITNGLEFIRNLSFYKQIAKMGTISLKTMDLFDFKIQNLTDTTKNGSISIENLATIPLMEAFIYLLIAIFVFSISVRLLERKVEV